MKPIFNKIILKNANLNFCQNLFVPMNSRNLFWLTFVREMHKMFFKIISMSRPTIHAKGRTLLENVASNVNPNQWITTYYFYKIILFHKCIILGLAWHLLKGIIKKLSLNFEKTYNIIFCKIQNSVFEAKYHHLKEHFCFPQEILFVQYSTIKATHSCNFLT